MDIREQFEYPLPVLKTEVEEIEIEAYGAYTGGILVANDGGGLLTGRIESNSPSVTFTPRQFTGNEIKVSYSLSLEHYRPGDIIRTGAVIMSNGGEKILPIIVKIIAPAIITKEGFKIAGLNDFFSYGEEYPIPARQLLMSREFMEWLLGIGYKHMEVFEQIIKDPNKERALDNFFIISKLKEKTTLALLEKKVALTVAPCEKEPVPGVIPVQRTDKGFVEAEIKVKHESPWIKLVGNRLTGADFQENNLALIRYYAEPALLPGRYGRDIVMIGDGLAVPVTLKKSKLLLFTLSKEIYGFDDVGEITVFNNSGRDLKLEIATGDTYLKFEGKKYFIGAAAKIPFTTKVTALTAAQLSLKKQPFIHTSIEIKTIIADEVYKKTLVLRLGS